MMLKKIIIIALIVAAAMFLYNKFIKDTMEPFFGKKAKNVDLFQHKSTIDGMEID